MGYIYDTDSASASEAKLCGLYEVHSYILLINRLY